nr:MBL fold metallo-hydrolase [Desulfobacula sp.]
MVVLETPGHSPAHSSFYFPDEKILFSGDLGLDRFGPGTAGQTVISKNSGIPFKAGRPGGGTCPDQPRRHDSKKGPPGLSELYPKDHGTGRKNPSQTGQGDESGRRIARQGVFYRDKDKVPEPMKSFLNMWDTAMFHHHEALIKEGGLIRFFPEIRKPAGGNKS